MMALRIARLRRALGLSQSLAEALAALIYGSDSQ